MGARNSMRQTRPSAILVTLVYFLLTTLLLRVILAAVGSPWVDTLYYLEMGYDAEEVINYVFIQGPGRIAMFGLVSLLVSLYETVMDFGYTSYALRLARNEQPSYRNLLDGFAKVWRVLWANILIGIFVGLWELLFLVPAMVVFVMIMLAGGGMAIILLLIGGILMVAGCVAALGISYRYRLTSYFLLDDPNCTAWQAIRRSKQAMRGWKMEMFLLDLSFLGWTLLSLLTWGILNIWLLPYRCATEANFYDCVTAGSRTSGGYTGTGYDYHVGESPEPF